MNSKYSCSKCEKVVAIYQKDRLENLKQMYFDTIFEANIIKRPAKQRIK